MKSHTQKKKRIWPRILIPALLLLAIAGFFIFLYPALTGNLRPFFNRDGVVTTSSDRLNPVTPYPGADAAPAVPEDPKDTGLGEDDSDFIHLMIFGIDTYGDGLTTIGTEPHTDTSIVCSINLKNDTVDLTSIPRDTFTPAPGHRGYYKFNGIFNVGGGPGDMDSGLALSCQAASNWMGGIPISSYFAFDFEAVTEIVDAIGGIDFDVDIPFWDNDPERDMKNGNYHEPGMQHLDGKGVLGYIRIRKAADGLDSSRTDRQRRMLAAIFRKLRESNLLTSIPAILEASSEHVHTNLNLLQITSLAAFAKRIEPEAVRLHALEGKQRYKYNWVFYFINDTSRCQLLRELYGIEAEPMGYTPEFEDFFQSAGVYALKIHSQAERLFLSVQDSGTSLDGKAKDLYDACYEEYRLLNESYNAQMDWIRFVYTQTANKAGLHDEYESRVDALNVASVRLYKALGRLAAELGYEKDIDRTPNKIWCTDPDINDVQYDFG